MHKLNTLLISCLLAAVTSQGQAATETDPEFAVAEVARGLYMLSGVGGFTGGNIALSVGSDGVIMIDDSMPPLLEKMKQAIGTVTDLPVDFLVNTHVHGDHTGNNMSIANDGTHIVAHENLRSFMANKGIPGMSGIEKAAPGALPVITFSENLSFHLNNQEAELFHLPQAHTDGDAAIHFKQSNVMHTGDVFFNGLFPFIDYNSGGSLDGYIAGQKAILSRINPQTKIIPGHGPLGSYSDLQNSIRMLEDSRSIISKLVKQGKSEEEVVATNPLAKFDSTWSWAFISTEIMTRQVYKGLTASH